MGKILAFAGSNSSTSINYQLVKHTVSLIENHETHLLNMVNYPFPLYSEDIEKRMGFSNSLVEFKYDIEQSDALIISVNEHNGNVSAYFKNVLDWLSRLERSFLAEKKIMLMSTSPGKRGGISALEIAEDLLQKFGAKIITTFSLPSFGKDFSEKDGIISEAYRKTHQHQLDTFLAAL